jgi:DNA-directed RNA polymerase II subunit RPB1
MEFSAIKTIKFTIPSTSEIVSTLSTVEISNPMTTVEFAKNNTLFDTRMGAFRNVPCGHCKREFKDCIGHHGRIKLATPCVNPEFIDTNMKKILSLYCFGCYTHLVSCKCVTEQMVRGKLTKRIVSKQIRIIKLNKRHRDARLVQGIKYAFKWETTDEKYMPLKELHYHISKIPANVYFRDFMHNDCSKYDNLTELVFLHYLLVLPTTCRPPNMSNGVWKACSISRSYVNVLRSSINLTMCGTCIPSHLFDEYHYQLQGAIDILFDVTQTNNKLRDNVTRGGGIRQRIDGKGGRIRKHLMGKRTEFSARTVLSGDPRLGINEVGVPRAMADNLTIPVTINRYNIRDFKYGDQRRVKYVLKKDGRRYDADIFKKFHLEIGDVVERRLVNGDIVAVNRQPTLHRGSIIACYIRIFDSLTFRLNYSTMITLNADTDGDEVNIHVPQDIESRTELETLMMASQNIVSSQSSKPLIGCTQDSLLGCYLLSKVSELAINDYMDIMYDMGLDDDVFDQRNTTVSVKGTRFITATLNHIGVFIRRYAPNPDFLLIDNVVQYGLLNKAIVGTADDSIIHHIFLMSGHLKAAEFIHLIQTAATKWLDIRGFSVGISDCIVQHEKINFDGLEHRLTEQFFNSGGRWGPTDEGNLLDALGELTKLEAPSHLVDNRLLDMINAGSKGSISNFNQITRVVGQQIEGEGRISKRFSGGTRTMPHFTKFDHSAATRGLVKNSFINGLTPQEFFMHAMGGRIGLIDTAIKTSETGAQNRRLIKVLEPLTVIEHGNGERAVINQSNKRVVQFHYGGDSYDATYMKRLKLDETDRYVR